MKKTIQLLVFMLVGASVFAQTGVIRELSGTVEIGRPGADFTAARTGDRVSQDTIISTGFRSTALIEVGSAVITVRPLTHLTLKQINVAAGEETLNVNLRTGRVRVDLNPPTGIRPSMGVRSPSATASVRGTSFEFDGRNILVDKGIVGFAGGAGHAVLVGAGSSSSIGRDGRAVNADFAGGDILPELPSMAAFGRPHAGGSGIDINIVHPGN